MARARKTIGLPARSLGTLTVAVITGAALFGCDVIIIDGVSTGGGGGGPAAGVGGSGSAAGVGGSPSGVSTGSGSSSVTGVGGSPSGVSTSSGSSSVTGAGGAGGAELCISDGDPCAVAADCCSGLCTNGACETASSCAPDGEACSVDADCCSQLCSNGTCAVTAVAYSTSFEGACPDGWTLTGDWECGVPMNVGPAMAYTGTQCIATKIAGIYSSLQTWNEATATSPEIDLTNAATPMLTFRMWIDTEGATYDGANLQISTDGTSYAVVTDVVPMYSLTVGGEPAWGGHQEALGWQLMQADLSSYAGQIIRLRFAFRTDSSGDYAGVYIDDILVH